MNKKKVIEILQADYGWCVLKGDKSLLADMLDDTIEATKKAFSLTDVVYSNRYKTDEYLVYTPSDDESVVVIEDTFKTQKTVDIKDFNNLMSVLHSVQDY